MKHQLAPASPWDTISNTTVELGTFAFEALGGADNPPADVSRRLLRAIQIYLDGSDADGMA